MNTHLHRLLSWTLLVLFAIALVPISALAAEAAVSAPSPFGGIVDLFTPLIALGVTFAAKAIGKLPGWVLPLVAALTGGAYEVITQLATGSAVNPLQGILYGCAATWLHQLKAQLGKPKAIEE